MPKLEFGDLQIQCNHFLTHHGPLSARQSLTEILAATGEVERMDVYCAGTMIADFEKEVADLLGKEAAVFMPSGTMAQQIALRIHADQRRGSTVAFHPRCHLENHEDKAYQHLHHLNSVLVGSYHNLLTLADLEKVSDPIQALLLELPQRNLGSQLPLWDDLNAQAAWARARGAAVHMDGARLWEAQPFYQRPYAEICSLFDSVYVSFYKTLGGISGAMLLGDAAFIRQARVWMHRHGGQIIHQFPALLSARLGLRTRLPRIPDYVQRNLEIAHLLTQFDKISIIPRPPHTNMMHLALRGDRQKLEDAAYQIAIEKGIFSYYALGDTTLPDWHLWEFVTGDATLKLSLKEIEAFFAELLDRAA